MDWIKVEDKLPAEGQRVIYYFDVVGIFIGKYSKEYCEELGDSMDCFCGDGFLCDDVTHWMPLPEPPEKEPDPAPSPKPNTHYVYCPSCGYENFDCYVGYSRTTANGDWYLCPGCGEETSSVDIGE